MCLFAHSFFISFFTHYLLRTGNWGKLRRPNRHYFYFKEAYVEFKKKVLISLLVPNPSPFFLLYSVSSPDEYKFKIETKPFITMLRLSFPAVLEVRAGHVTQFCPMRHKINTISEKIPEGTFVVLVKETNTDDVHSCSCLCLSLSISLFSSCSFTCLSEVLAGTC